jgi:hypothetical protein
MKYGRSRKALRNTASVIDQADYTNNKRRNGAKAKNIYLLTPPPRFPFWVFFMRDRNVGIICNLNMQELAYIAYVGLASAYHLHINFSSGQPVGSEQY